MLRRLLAVPACLLALLCALPSYAATRTLVVYPFAVNGSVPEDLGGQLSDKIAAEIVALGGVEVVHGAAAAKPADYRTAARAAGADFYFSGSIASVFNRYAAIENLVSTRSGTVVWSVSLQFRTLADVVGEGGRVRDELYRGEGAPPPGIAASGAALVTPSPMSGFAVLPVTGSALESDRAFALRSLVETLRQRGFTAVRVTSSAAIDPGAGGPAACTQSGARTLIAGTLDTTRVATSGAAPQTTAHIALRTYDCRLHASDLQATVVNHIAAVANDAIRGAVEDAVSAFPSPS
jgi:TolB-like protein